jgi:hypothetical protein
MIIEIAAEKLPRNSEDPTFSSNAADTTNFCTFFDCKRIQESHGDENPAANGGQESKIYTGHIG